MPAARPLFRRRRVTTPVLLHRSNIPYRTHLHSASLTYLLPRGCSRLVCWVAAVRSGTVRHCFFATYCVAAHGRARLLRWHHTTSDTVLRPIPYTTARTTFIAFTRLVPFGNFMPFMAFSPYFYLPFGIPAVIPDLFRLRTCVLTLYCSPTPDVNTIRSALRARSIPPPPLPFQRDGARVNDTARGACNERILLCGSYNAGSAGSRVAPYVRAPLCYTRLRSVTLGLLVAGSGATTFWRVAQFAGAPPLTTPF